MSRPRKAVPKKEADELTIQLFNSVFPEYAKGLPIEIKNVTYQGDEPVEIIVEFYLIDDYGPSELTELTGWLIADVTELDDWEIKKVETNIESGSIQGVIQFEREAR